MRKHLGDGYNINFGLTFMVTPVIGIQAEYSYNGLGEKQIQVPPTNLPAGSTQSPVFADMNMQYGNFNLVFKPPTSGKAKPYIVAGMGVYYRPVKVTTPSVGYVPPYCDPWWYYCWPGGFVEVDQVLASRSSTGFGIDFGGGVNFWASESVGDLLRGPVSLYLGSGAQGRRRDLVREGQRPVLADYLRGPVLSPERGPGYRARVEG